MAGRYHHKRRGAIISGDARSVNFREIHAGNIAPATLYRSSHPIQDGRQEPVIAALAAKYRIAAVINLTDTNSELQSKVFVAPWYNRLFLDSKVIALGMDFSVTSDNFRQKLKKALQFIIETESPYLIHCHAGVDRTGFVLIVLEALMGAAIKEIANDYLMSFNSIFESSIYSYENKTNSLVVMRLLSVLGGDLAITDLNLRATAEHYAKDTIGLSDKEIDLLKMKLSGGKIHEN
ncbi:MAG: tyrosine-protein phosphatase [Treponema sp.]|jgi:protein-tyrosine phosphatase|nr:tyrosine-protein phosphatase [Treponema sp.]